MIAKCQEKVLRWRYLGMNKEVTQEAGSPLPRGRRCIRSLHKESDTLARLFNGEVGYRTLFRHGALFYSLTRVRGSRTSVRGASNGSRWMPRPVGDAKPYGVQSMASCGDLDEALPAHFRREEPCACKIQ